MEPESFYTIETPPSERYGKPPVLDRSRQRFDDGSGSGNGNGNGNSNGGLSRDAAGSQSMRSTTSGGGGRYDRATRGAADPVPPRRTSIGSTNNRKMWADDRSPLQRLELTLDSITKEEKRARVEAAERRMREKAEATAAEVAAEGGGAPAGAPAPAPVSTGNSGNGGDRQVKAPGRRSTGGQQQQVRFRDTRNETPPLDQEETHRPIAADPVLAQPSAAVSNTITAATNNNTAQTEPPPAGLRPPEANGPKQYDLTGLSPRSRIATAINASVEGAQRTSLPPQRNLSFRERAGKNDIDLPRESIEASPPPALPPAAAAAVAALAAAAQRPVTSPNGGSIPTRNSSNKLRKNPPGDPWYNVRRDAEERATSSGQPHVTPREQQEIARENAAAANVIRTRSMSGAIKKPPPSHYETMGGGPPPRRDPQFAGYEAVARSNPQFQAARGPPPPDVRVGRSNTMPSGRQPLIPAAENMRQAGSTVSSVRFAGIPDHDEDDDDEKNAHHHRFRNYMHPLHGRHRPDQTIYQKPQYLDEWENATTGVLSDTFLDLSAVESAVEESDSPDEQHSDKTDRNPPIVRNDQTDPAVPWWENKRRSSYSQPPDPKPQPKVQPKPKPVVVREPEVVNDRGHTGFKPPLYLKCGPLLRYCGIRKEGPEVQAGQTTSTSTATNREFWRGSVMIVTNDSESSYEVAPSLRLFVQPIELLPPPPAELRGVKLPEEYVDPIAGIPKVGRRGETLYVKPIESFEEAKDVSLLEPDDGLFEITRSPPNFDPRAPEPPLSFTSRTKRRQVDGEKVGKYQEVRGFRLHAEQGYTFWRFNIEVELRDAQQRIAYRINRGPATAFWVPARSTSMNVMFYSCNGFSLSVNPDELTGPDPMWRDVLNTHQTRPFHVMLGGGDQIYNDAVMRETQHFQNWLKLKNPLHKKNAQFTADMQAELEAFYFERYAKWFSRGLFGLANSQIPMVNMYDDHDIIDGFGSYPHHFMNSPVFSGLGNVAFKYYMLFQHQSLPVETEQTEPSWCLGTKPGPYIKELSRSLLMSLGGSMALLAVDCRTERTQKEVVQEETWRAIMDRCYEEIKTNETQHLLVLLGVPIAYPRLVWLENM